MNMKNQLRIKFEMQEQQEKRRKQEERIKNRIENTAYKKLKRESKDSINQRLLQIVLNTPFCNEDGWVHVKVKFPEKGQEEQWILDNGYRINQKDIKRFCRKYKLKLKYQYKCNSEFYGITLSHTYKWYKGERHLYEGRKAEFEYLEAYRIGIR